MQVLLYVLCFFGGVVFTMLALLAYSFYLGMQERVRLAETSKKEMKEEQKAATELVRRRHGDLQAAPAPHPQVPADVNVAASVKDRLRKAVELTSKQAKIDTRKGPEFVMEHNELELEKLSVLKTILADGFDPVILIRYNTGDQEMLLSTYIQSINKGLA